MPKKSQADLKHRLSQAADSVDFSDEKTKPNIRLVQAMSNRPQFAKKKISVPIPSESLGSAPGAVGIAKWLPYVFGVLMAFGFVHLQSGKPSVRAKAMQPTVVKEFQSQNAYTSPILETVRSASNK